MYRNASKLFESSLSGCRADFGSNTTAGFASETLLADDVNPEDKSAAVGRAAKEPDKSLLSAKILVVDDDITNVKACRKHLNDLGYQNTVGLTDSTKAVSMILEERPDLVILDVMMPQVSGVEILKAVRNRPELHHMPILILIASSDRTTKLTVLDLGATDFLTKPIDPIEMAPRVRNVLTVKKCHDSIRGHVTAMDKPTWERTAELNPPTPI